MHINKNKILVTGTSILLLLLTSCGTDAEPREVSTSGSVAIEDNSNENVEKEVVIRLIGGLTKDLEAFNEIYKKTLFNTGKLNEIGIKQTEQTLDEWNKIMAKFIGKKVVGYQKTEKLDDKLEIIGKFISEANTFVSEGNMPEAHEKLEHVRKEIRKIRQENGVKSISDEMLTVHDIMEKIVENSGNKNLTEFENINTGIENLKRFNIGNNEYENILLKFETTVIELSKLEGEEYKTKLKELKPAFIKMYMKFG